MTGFDSDQPRAATFAEDGWILEDAEARHQAHPATFWIPDFSLRDNLEGGDWAKLIFLPSDQTRHTGERMWAEVEVRNGSFYRGRLLNTPVVIKQLQLNSVFWFEPHHIIDTLLKSEQELDA